MGVLVVALTARAPFSCVCMLCVSFVKSRKDEEVFAIYVAVCKFVDSNV